MTVDDYFHSEVATNVFLGELSVSAFLLLAISCTILLAPNIHRSAVSVNIYISFLIYCVSYLILPITGQWNVAEPPFGVCLLSAIGNYASFPLCAVAVFALSLSLWLNVTVYRRKPGGDLMKYCLLYAPYLVWVGLIIETLAIGFINREDVVRHSYPYCIIGSSIPGSISRALLAVFLLPSMVLQGSTFYRLFSVASPFREDPVRKQALRQRVIRMSVFSLGSIGALILTLLFSLNLHNDTPQVIIQGACPLWAVLAFGTQKEIIQVWMQWLQRRPTRSHSESKIHLASIESNITNPEV